MAVMLGSTVGVQLFSVADSFSMRRISLPAMSTSFLDRDEESIFYRHLLSAIRIYIASGAPRSSVSMVENFTRN